MEKQLKTEILRLIEKCREEKESGAPMQADSLVEAVIERNARVWNKLREEAGRKIMARMVKAYLDGLTTTAAEESQLKFDLPGFQELPLLILTPEGWLPALQATREQWMQWRTIRKERWSKSVERFESKRDGGSEYDKQVDRIIRTMAPVAKHDPSVTLEGVLTLKIDKYQTRVQKRDARARAHIAIATAHK